MDASKAVVLGLGAVCLVFVLRNLAGAPSRFGVVTGRISMLAFATFAAFCFWKARELRLASAPSDIVWGMQRLLLGRPLHVAPSVGFRCRIRMRVSARATLNRSRDS